MCGALDWLRASGLMAKRSLCRGVYQCGARHSLIACCPARGEQLSVRQLCELTRLTRQGRLIFCMGRTRSWRWHRLRGGRVV